MKVSAIHVGKKIMLKSLQVKLKPKVVFKDPLILHEEKKYAVLFKYGVAVFWGFSKAEQDRFLKKIRPYIENRITDHSSEVTDVVYPKSKRAIKENKIHLKNLNLDKIALISIILGRSVALEYYEKEVEKALLTFDPVMKSVEEEGKIKFSSRNLFRKIGFAMNVRHLSLSQMALLDRPDITWEDMNLSRFYDELADEYEIDDRYDILKEKLEIIFRNSEFILGFIESKRSMLLEVTIIILIMIEIVIFIYEVWLI